MDYTRTTEETVEGDVWQRFFFWWPLKGLEEWGACDFCLGRRSPPHLKWEAKFSAQLRLEVQEADLLKWMHAILEVVVDFDAARPTREFTEDQLQDICVQDEGLRRIS